MKALLKKSEIPEILDLQDELCKHIEIPKTGIVDSATIAALDHLIQSTGYAESNYIQEKVEAECANPAEIQDFIRECAINDILKERYKEDICKIEKFFEDLSKNKHKESGIIIIESYDPEYQGSEEYKKFSEGGMSAQIVNRMPDYADVTVRELRNFAASVPDKGVQRSLRKQNMFEGLSDDQVVRIYKDNTFEILGGGPQRGIKKGGLGLGGSGRRHASEVIFRKAQTINDWKPQQTEKPKEVEVTVEKSEEPEYAEVPFNDTLVEINKETGISKDNTLRWYNNTWYEKDENDRWILVKPKEEESLDELKEKEKPKQRGTDENRRVQAELFANLENSISKEKDSRLAEQLKSARDKLVNSSKKGNSWDGIIGKNTLNAQKVYEEYLQQLEQKSRPSNTPAYISSNTPPYSPATSTKTTSTTITEEEKQELIGKLSHGGVVSGTVFSKFRAGGYFQDGGKFTPEEKQAFLKLPQVQQDKVLKLIKEGKVSEARVLGRKYIKSVSTSTKSYLATDYVEGDEFKSLIYDIGSIALDLGAALNPEPISSVGLGVASETLQELKPGERGGWDRALGYGATALGLIPVVGGWTKGARAVSKIGKIVSKLSKIPSSTLGKLLLPSLGVATVAEGADYLQDNPEIVTEVADGVKNLLVRASNADLTTEDAMLLANIGTSIVAGLTGGRGKKLDAKSLEKLRNLGRRKKPKVPKPDKTLKLNQSNPIQQPQSFRTTQAQPETGVNSPSDFRRRQAVNTSLVTVPGKTSQLMLPPKGLTTAYMTNIVKKNKLNPDEKGIWRKQGGTLFTPFKKGGKFIKAQSGLKFKNQEDVLDFLGTIDQNTSIPNNRELQQKEPGYGYNIPKLPAVNLKNPSVGTTLKDKSAKATVKGRAKQVFSPEVDSETIADDKTKFVRSNQQFLENLKAYVAERAGRVDVKVTEPTRIARAIRPATLITDTGANERESQARQFLRSIRRQGDSPAGKIAALSQLNKASQQASAMQAAQAQQELGRVDAELDTERKEVNKFQDALTEMRGKRDLVLATQESKDKTRLAQLALDATFGNVDDMKQNLVRASQLGAEEVKDLQMAAINNALTANSPEGMAYRNAKNALDNLPEDATDEQRKAAQQAVAEAKEKIYANDKTYAEEYKKALKKLYSRAGVSHTDSPEYRQGGVLRDVIRKLKYENNTK